MSGIYHKINKILKFINPQYDSDHYMIWAALSHPDNKILDLKHKYQASYSVDESKKVFIQACSNSNGFHFVKEWEIYKVPLSEDTAHEVYRALEEVALSKIEEDFKLEQEKKIKREKIKYLNSRIYPKSMNFILED